MTNPTIRHRHTGAVLFEGEAGMTTRAMLEKATLRGANLGCANLRGADLGGADLSCADLGGADLRGADLGCADLSGADLGGADLGCANLGGANLGGADLGGANLRDDNLRGANLRGADLGCADLSGANLGGADLGCANLRGANLRGTNLRGADLRGADLGEKFGKLIEGRPFFQCGPIGSRSDYLQSFITDKGIVIKAGCFTGFLDEFVQAIEKTHGDSDHGKEYSMAVLMVESHAAIWIKK